MPGTAFDASRRSLLAAVAGLAAAGVAAPALPLRSLAAAATGGLAKACVVPVGARLHPAVAAFLARHRARSLARNSGGSCGDYLTLRQLVSQNIYWNTAQPDDSARSGYGDPRSTVLAMHADGSVEFAQARIPWPTDDELRRWPHRVVADRHVEVEWLADVTTAVEAVGPDAERLDPARSGWHRETHAMLFDLVVMTRWAHVLHDERDGGRRRCLVMVRGAPVDPASLHGCPPPCMLSLLDAREGEPIEAVRFRGDLYGGDSTYEAFDWDALVALVDQAEPGGRGDRFVLVDARGARRRVRAWSV